MPTVYINSARINYIEAGSGDATVILLHCSAGSVWRGLSTIGSALLLSGEQTPAPTQRVTELLAGAIPGARRSIIAGAGHMAPLTHAEQVNALIVGHLRRSMMLKPRRIAA